MSEREELLRSRGWSQWYNSAYWVHMKTVQNPGVQDYTNYGLSLDKAYEFETQGGKPFPSIAPFQKAISSLYRDEFDAPSASVTSPNVETTKSQAHMEQTSIKEPDQKSTSVKGE